MEPRSRLSFTLPLLGSDCCLSFDLDLEAFYQGWDLDKGCSRASGTESFRVRLHEASSFADVNYVHTNTNDVPERRSDLLQSCVDFAVNLTRLLVNVFSNDGAVLISRTSSRYEDKISSPEGSAIAGAYFSPIEKLLARHSGPPSHGLPQPGKRR